jgi:hypothetical protein
MRKLVSSVTVVAALLMGFAPRAGAATLSGTATGTFTNLSDTQTTTGSAGGDTYIDEVLPLTYHGGLSGIAIDTDTFVVHHDGSYVGIGTEVCASCSIGGRTGTLIASFLFAGSGSTYAGTLLFTRATGGLAGLHGGGTFKGTATSQTYAYTYRFAPKP